MTVLDIKIWGLYFLPRPLIALHTTSLLLSFPCLPVKFHSRLYTLPLNHLLHSIWAKFINLYIRTPRFALTFYSHIYVFILFIYVCMCTDKISLRLSVSLSPPLLASFLFPFVHLNYILLFVLISLSLSYILTYLRFEYFILEALCHSTLPVSSFLIRPIYSWDTIKNIQNKY